MKAVYSYKIFPEHRKPLDRTFWELAAYSVKSASKYYKTVFYSDKESGKLFDRHGIYFDEYHILPEIEAYNGNVYNVRQIHEKIAEKEPYVHLDFDSVILEEIISPHTITYAYTEVDLKNLAGYDRIDYVHGGYVKPYKDLLVDIFKDDIIYPDFNIIPNHSFFMVKNPTIVREFYKRILRKIPADVLEQVSPTLLEQCLLYLFLKEHETDIGYVSWYTAEKFLEREYGSYKFLHLPYYSEPEKRDEVEYVLKRLREQFGPI